MLNDEFRQALEECDVALVRKAWAYVAPGLPQPKTDAEALVTIHVARTQTRSIAFKLRAYSHKWLTERGYPSMLPDELRPAAERIYPRIVEGVGLSINAKSPLMQAIKPNIEQVMTTVVKEMYAEGDTEPGLVKSRMLAAKDREVARLIGKLQPK